MLPTLMPTSDMDDMAAWAQQEFYANVDSTLFNGNSTVILKKVMKPDCRAWGG